MNRQRLMWLCIVLRFERTFVGQCLHLAKRYLVRLPFSEIRSPWSSKTSTQCSAGYRLLLNCGPTDRWDVWRGVYPEITGPATSSDCCAALRAGEASDNMLSWVSPAGYEGPMEKLHFANDRAEWQYGAMIRLKNFFMSSSVTVSLIRVSLILYSAFSFKCLT